MLLHEHSLMPGLRVLMSQALYHSPLSSLQAYTQRDAVRLSARWQAHSQSDQPSLKFAAASSKA